MFKNIENILKKKSTYNLISIYKKDNEVSYQYIELSFKNSEIKIHNKFTFNELNESKIQDKLKNNSELLLYFDGDFILNKKVEKKANYKNELIFNASLNEFYFYEYYQEKDIFVSIVRKNIINNFISEFNNRKIFVSNISIGPFSLVNLFSALKTYSEFSTPYTTLSCKNNKIVEFKNTSIKSTYRFGQEELNEKELPLISTFLDFKYQNHSIKFKTDFLNQDREEHKYKKRFMITGIFSLVFLLLSLFISHITLNKNLNLLIQKKVEYVSVQNVLSKIDNYKNEIETKESILKKSGLTNNIYMAQLISELGNETLSSITIDKININPIIKKIRVGEKINSSMNEILIEGVSTNDTSFNEWILKLNAIKWVKKIDILNYVETKNKKNTFSIKLSI